MFATCSDVSRNMELNSRWYPMFLKLPLTGSSFVHGKLWFYWLRSPALRPGPVQARGHFLENWEWAGLGG